MCLNLELSKRQGTNSPRCPPGFTRLTYTKRTPSTFITKSGTTRVGRPRQNEEKVRSDRRGKNLYLYLNFKTYSMEIKSGILGIVTDTLSKNFCIQERRTLLKIY